MESWRTALVTSNFTLEQAIEVLDKAAMRIALVVDKNQKLLGTLSDGDVRRALLKRQPLDTNVTAIMNARPKTIDASWTESRRLALMEQHLLLQLPVVDGEGRVVGLTSLHDIVNKHRHDNPVLLMAGGFGTRLRPLTDNCPKPMLKVGGKPILELIMLNFIEAGFHRFFISTHYMPEVIRNHFGNGNKWGVSIHYVHEKEPLGTAGALGLLPRDEIDKPLVMMNGDLLTFINIHSLLEYHEHHNGVATMGVREYEHTVPYGVIISEGAQVKSIVEKPLHKFFVNAGIYILDPTLIKELEPGTCVDMPTLLEQEINLGKVVNMCPIHEYWLDIGQIKDFDQAQLDLALLGQKR